MASAVDKQPAAARLAAVAAAGQLTTATDSCQSSYTTCGDTTPALTWFCVRSSGAAQRSGWMGGISLAGLARHVGARQGDVVEACVTALPQCPCVAISALPETG